MTTWTEVVTTALLGTGRRPVPSEPPLWAAPTDITEHEAAEARVLDLAAAHRVAALAGRRSERTVGGLGATAVPAQALPLAPPAARRLLDTFLSRPEGSTVNLWLAACARHGRGVAPEHWAALARLCARSTTYDRRLLGAVLGDRGRWFVRQNPEWARLATVLDEQTGQAPFDKLRAHDGLRPEPEPGMCPEREPGMCPEPEPGMCPEPVEGQVPPAPTADQLRKDPELLLATPDPWPVALLDAALAGLVEGRMGGNPRPYARAIGARLTAAQYAELGRQAGRFLELPRLVPAQRRAVRSLFVEIEKAGFDRIEIDRAFDPDAVRVFKINIPHV